MLRLAFGLQHRLPLQVAVRWFGCIGLPSIRYFIASTLQLTKALFGTHGSLRQAPAYVPKIRRRRPTSHAAQSGLETSELLFGMAKVCSSLA